MQSVRDLKRQAKGLRSHLSDQGVSVTHSQSLESIARVNGFRDWNTAAATASPDAPPTSAIDGKSAFSRSGVVSEPLELERITGSVIVPARWGNEDSDGKVTVLNISPSSSQHFDPRSVALVGIDPTDMSKRRFLVRGITVGGNPKELLSWETPASPGQSLLSDVFGFEGPRPVSWGPFSKEGCGLELGIHIFNMHDREIEVHGFIWGTPIHDECLYAWGLRQKKQKAEDS